MDGGKDEVPLAASHAHAARWLAPINHKVYHIYYHQAGCVEALLLAAEAHRAALLPTSALPYALAALHHARRLSLDLLAARAVVALADVRLALGVLSLAVGTSAAPKQKSPGAAQR
jgi:hypothetical protein